MVCSCDTAKRGESQSDTIVSAEDVAMSQVHREAAAQALAQDVSRYSIQNLTINSYGPLTILSDKPSLGPSSSALMPAGSETTKDDRPLKAQAKWHTANVQLTNGMEGTLRSITLRHRRGGSSGVRTEKTWENVGPGETTDIFETDFQSGFGADFDYWPFTYRLKREARGSKATDGSSATLAKQGRLEDQGEWVDMDPDQFTTSARDISLFHEAKFLGKQNQTWTGTLQIGEVTSPWLVYWHTTAVPSTGDDL
ncbi:MAG: hypothetical protein L6R40_005105 [Gallowayella cf. fulva]|nr:MAG: hypothetical protein L6R40_005105 [Xanthomendoza cf. fulva]